MKRFIFLLVVSLCICLAGCGKEDEPTTTAASDVTTTAEITTSQQQTTTDEETTEATTTVAAGYYDYFTAEEIDAAKKATKNYFENVKEDPWYISDVRDFTRANPLEYFKKAEPGTVIMFVAIVDSEKTPDYSWPEELDVILEKDSNGEWQVKDFGW